MNTLLRQGIETCGGGLAEVRLSWEVWLRGPRWDRERRQGSSSSESSGPGGSLLPLPWGHRALPLPPEEQLSREAERDGAAWPSGYVRSSGRNTRVSSGNGISNTLPHFLSQFFFLQLKNLRSLLSDWSLCYISHMTNRSRGCADGEQFSPSLCI